MSLENVSLSCLLLASHSNEIISYSSFYGNFIIKFRPHSSYDSVYLLFQPWLSAGGPIGHFPLPLEFGKTI